MLGVVLYPYVYLFARAMFLMQAASLIDAARMLGSSGTGVFLRVALPMARPAIAVGTSLALMEALNDIGASEFLGVQTLTVSIYATWINRTSMPGAAQIAIAMLVVVVTLIVIERGRAAGNAMPPTRPRPPVEARAPRWRVGDPGTGVVLHPGVPGVPGPCRLPRQRGL